jgi:hypothetical protein
MDQLMALLQRVGDQPGVGLDSLAAGALCAVGCGLIVAETYRRTHRGIDSYRPFLQVLIVVAVVVCFVTLIVGNDLARAFTLVGALSVIRFRTAVKEARDLAFIFWAVAAGMGAGCLYTSATIVFCVGVATLIALLHRFNYGVHDAALKLLRVRMDSEAAYDSLLAVCFEEHLVSHERLSVSLVRQGTLYELVYLVQLQPDVEERALLTAIRGLTGDHPLTLSERDPATSF